MDYLERYKKNPMEVNMYLTGRKNEVNWNTVSTWTIPEINKAVKYFKSIAEMIEDETIVYRGTTSPSPIMDDLALELPAPGREKFSQILSVTYDIEMAHKYSHPKNKVVGYLHILRLQPGVKYVVSEDEILLTPGYKLFLEKTRPIEYSIKHIKKWECTWLVF